MYLIQQQQAEIVKEFNGLATKCPPTTTATQTAATTAAAAATTMKMSSDETPEFVGRKNGINGNVSASPRATTTTTRDSDPDDLSMAASSPNINFSRLSLGSAATGQRLPLTENKNVQPAADDTLKPGNNGQRKSAATITGERLQFFKDGKFILELARAREGDKTGWISVPRKSFWPSTVQSSTSANFKKHESSASLSYSDDNSSIQSSPWQRDHCWKQTRPQHNISKEMSLYHFRPKKSSVTSPEHVRLGLMKRRRPYDNRDAAKQEEKVEEEVQSNGEHTNGSKEEITEDGDSPDCVDGKVNGSSAKKRSLSIVLKRLSDRIKAGNAITARLNHLATPQQQQHLSPRKRILERVSLDDASSKRSRAKTHTPVVSRGTLRAVTTPPLTASSNIYASVRNGDTHTVSATGTSNIPVASPPQALTVAAVPAATTQPQRVISNYSITSLLGHNSPESSKRDTSHSKTEPYKTERSPSSPPASAEARHATTPSNSASKKRSPTYGTPSPNNHNLEYYNISMRSPDLSPSPEQPQGFIRYRPPSAFTQQHSSSSYMRGSPSPSSSSLDYNPKYRSSLLSSGSPNQHHHHPYQSSASPSHQQQQHHHHHRQSPIPGYHQQQRRSSPHVVKTESPTRYRMNKSPSLSPTIEEPPMREVVPSPGVRNLPKKTAALRQQFNQTPPISLTVRERLHREREEREKERERERERQREREHEEREREKERVREREDRKRKEFESYHMHPHPHDLGAPSTTQPPPPSFYPYLYPAGAPPPAAYLGPLYYQQMYAAAAASAAHAAAAAAYRPMAWMPYNPIAGPPPHSMAGPPPSASPPPLLTSSHKTSAIPSARNPPPSSPPLQARESRSHWQGRGDTRQDERTIPTSKETRSKDADMDSDVPLNLSKH